MAGLRVAFIGNQYLFSRVLCGWLAEHADLRLIVWADKIPWPHRPELAWARVARRILRGARRKGVWRAIDEAAFYVLYLLFLRHREEERNRSLAETLEIKEGRPIEEIRQISPTRIDDPQLMEMLRLLQLDAIFTMCVDVYFPKPLIDAPRLGVFLWHEGITPEYRGVYSNFWALLRKDYACVGYTLLKMNRKLDGGPIYVQGPVEGADFGKDWHSYLGHKAIIDSLPHVERFLHDLESSTHRPIDRPGAKDVYYSYPTGTALARIAGRRLLNRIRADTPGSRHALGAFRGVRPSRERKSGEMNARAISPAAATPPAEGGVRQLLEAALPRVSIIMPIYNEATWIDRSLTAVLRQDYPRHLLEVLVADSHSNDGTVERLRGIMARHSDHDIRLLENSDRTPGAALNLMIREATGEIIVRVDGHTEVATDYVRCCVEALSSSDASNVGGCVSASGAGFVGRGIALAVASFWGNGGARYRNPPMSRPTYVDTVPFGAWKRETLSRLGPFIENWRVNEDCEFNARTLDAGGKILLHPAIRATYFPRASLRSLAKQYFWYGTLKASVIARHPKQLRARQLAPPLLVLTMLVSLAVATLGGMSTSLPLVAPLVYIFAIGIASLHIALRSGQVVYTPLLPAVLATLHLSYGVGVLAGMLQLLASFSLHQIPRLKRWVS